MHLTSATADGKTRKDRHTLKTDSEIIKQQYTEKKGKSWKKCDTLIARGRGRQKELPF